MANPYEWSDGRDRERRYDRGEEDARRVAERHAEQDREARRDPPHRVDRDYGAGWYGEDGLYEGYPAQGPHSRRSEERDDLGHYDPYGPDRGRGSRGSFEAEASKVGRDIGRGWRRLSQGVRRAFEDERGPGERDPRRGGGMFGGQDRRESLFNHDDGLGGRKLGPHRGKGPAGYARSDDRILEEISDRLTDDDRLDASDIEVKVEAGEVMLNGHVASRQDKRRAEDLAEQVSGVKHLQNNLRVKPAEPVPVEAQTSASMTAAPPGAAQPTPPPQPH